MKAKDVLLSTFVLPLAFSLVSFTVPNRTKNAVKGPLLNTVTENLQSNAGREKANSVDSTLKSYRTISSSTASSQSYHVEFETNTSSLDFIFGYYGEGDRYLPFVVQYQVVLEDGKTTERRETNCRKVSENNAYDGIGYNIGARTLRMDIDLPKKEGETIDRSSLKYFNIYLAERQSNQGFVPVLDKKYYYDGKDTTIERAAKDNVELGENLYGSIEEISTFGKYSAFSLTITNDRESRYGELKASAYKKWKAKIDSGEVYFYDTIPSLKDAVFQITLKNGETVERGAREGSLGSTMLLKNGKQKYCILFKDLPEGEIEYFSLAHIGFSRKLRYTSSEKDINSTEYKARVGRLTFYSGDPLKHERNDIKEHNFTRITILSIVLYLVIFGGLATGLFFYEKRKFRNDEFRRVNNKRFLFRSILVSVSLGVFFFDVFFILLRANQFNNTMTVYNPVDNFIVVLSILSIFAIGFFIKSGITAFKNWKQRKEQERLKLDDRSSDDGTK